MSKERGIKALVAVVVFMVGVIFGELMNCNRTGNTVETVVTTVEHDTTYTTLHDTCFIERAQRVVRHDTLLLARVDTIRSVDSVMVEIPIEEKRFDGDNYTILTEGFRVKLKSVDINYPTVTKTVTNTVTRQKRWSGSVGVQAGYGETIHGLSPYVGVGIGFGYNF